LVVVRSPTRNVLSLLLILRELGKVKGRIKLYKLHYLLEREGKVKFDVPINNYPLGPVDYLSVNFCTENGLISETSETGFPFDCFNISLTVKGERFLDKYLSEFPLEERKSALKIIGKYKDSSGSFLLQYVHKKYVDDFKNIEKNMRVISILEANVPVVFDLISRHLVNEKSEVGLDELYSSLGYLGHVKVILFKLRRVSDPVKVGQVVWTVKEFFDALKTGDYRSNSYVQELFEYLDNYCDKEKIVKSVSSDDFSDISRDVRTRLMDALAQM
jgi:hypothetical protein